MNGRSDLIVECGTLLGTTRGTNFIWKRRKNGVTLRTKVWVEFPPKGIWGSLSRRRNYCEPWKRILSWISQHWCTTRTGKEGNLTLGKRRSLTQNMQRQNDFWSSTDRGRFKSHLKFERVILLSLVITGGLPSHTCKNEWLVLPRLSKISLNGK